MFENDNIIRDAIIFSRALKDSGIEYNPCHILAVLGFLITQIIRLEFKKENQSEVAEAFGRVLSERINDRRKEYH